MKVGIREQSIHMFRLEFYMKNRNWNLLSEESTKVVGAATNPSPEGSKLDMWRFIYAANVELKQFFAYCKKVIFVYSMYLL